jgi:hypothetical protein
MGVEYTVVLTCDSTSTGSGQFALQRMRQAYMMDPLAVATGPRVHSARWDIGVACGKDRAFRKEIAISPC